MQLTIDTQKDSHAEIRKAIRMLMSLIDDKEIYTNEELERTFSPDKTPAANAFADMFGSADKDDDYSELNVPEEEKKEEEIKGIELY